MQKVREKYIEDEKKKGKNEDGDGGD